MPKVGLVREELPIRALDADQLSAVTLLPRRLESARTGAVCLVLGETLAHKRPWEFGPAGAVHPKGSLSLSPLRDHEVAIAL